MKTKKPIIEKDLTKFHFDESFKRTFDTVIDVYAKTLNELNKVSSGKMLKSEFGVCNCTYKMRYITPENISEYVSNLIKGIDSCLFEHNSTDIEMFSVASVKRFIEDNGCDVFESSSVLSSSHNYVNPKEYTLQDLLLISENDTGDAAVYSKGEMVKRLEVVGEDVNAMNKMHFTAAIKNIVRSMGDVIEKSNCCICNTPAAMEIFKVHLEEFIIFACTLNTITVLQMIGYLHPTVEYTPVQQGGGTQGVVTECCLCNTNDFMVRNFIPFNCNMRDIVLQDVTPNFRDVHDALHFIMRNYRSPISVLVNKFATKEANVGMDCGTVARMFSGHRDYHHDDDLFKKDGERMLGGQRPLDIAGFETSVTWLDNIAFGNNYIDGNYRRDGNGNATVHPIMNTLDMLYKIFNGVELKTNEDLANNVVRIACLMRGIIHDYNDERPIPNYDLVKDILVVLGEIFTRNMLKLYYNNTRVFTYSDDMPDTMDPGFICMESFIMEADAEKTPTGKQSFAAPKVTFTGANQAELKKNLKTKTSIMIQRFIEWVRTTIMKFVATFNKNHEKEIKWINENMELNKQITKAINEGTFTPSVTNMPRFNLQVKALQDIALYNNFEQKLKIESNNGQENTLDQNKFMIECITKEGSELYNALSKQTGNVDALTTTFTNYVLYGKTEQPDGFTGKLVATGNNPDTPSWEALYTSLLQFPKVMNEACKGVADDLDKTSTMLKQKTAELESTKSSNPNADKIDAKITRAEALNKALQDITKIYETPGFNSLTIKFFKINYNLYREIIAGYKQQSNDKKADTETSTEGDSISTKAVDTAETKTGTETT